jgi:hypothetical protein
LLTNYNQISDQATQKNIIVDFSVLHTEINKRMLSIKRFKSKNPASQGFYALFVMRCPRNRFYFAFLSVHLFSYISGHLMTIAAVIAVE